MSTSRRSNSAKPEDLVKVLRAHLPNGLDKKYLDHEPSMIVSAYEELISDVLLRTPRPTKTLLQAAAVKSWEQVKGSEAETWAERVAKAVSYCYSKRLQVSTCARQPPAVRRIIQQISKNIFGSKAREESKPKRALKPAPSDASTIAKRKRSKSKQLPVDLTQAEKKQHTDSPSSKGMSNEMLRSLYGLPPTSNPSSSSKGGAETLLDADAEIIDSSCEEIEGDVGEGGMVIEGGPAGAAPNPLQFWDGSMLAMVRTVRGKKIAAKMEEAEDPPHADHDAPEVAPDAVVPSEGDEQVGYQYDPEVPVPEDASYTCMYYKKDNKIGVRIIVKFDGKKFEKQVFSFGGRRCDMSEEALRKIGWQAVAKMREERQTPAVVESWAKGQV
ncbi:unnamed protein product [Symbiodinium sp. CCMP2592]|nr:unnamed protein product [Symbiodinium sp. CCMP2592]